MDPLRLLQEPAAASVHFNKPSDRSVFAYLPLWQSKQALLAATLEEPAPQLKQSALPTPTEYAPSVQAISKTDPVTPVPEHAVPLTLLQYPACASKQVDWALADV